MEGLAISFHFSIVLRSICMNQIVDSLAASLHIDSFYIFLGWYFWELVERTVSRSGWMVRFWSSSTMNLTRQVCGWICENTDVALNVFQHCGTVDSPGERKTPRHGKSHGYIRTLGLAVLDKTLSFQKMGYSKKRKKFVQSLGVLMYCIFYSWDSYEEFPVFYRTLEALVEVRAMLHSSQVAWRIRTF